MAKGITFWRITEHIYLPYIPPAMHNDGRGQVYYEVSIHLPCTAFLKAVYFFSGIGSDFPFERVTVKRLILTMYPGFTR